MGRSLILETSFLIDLEREHHRGRPQNAVSFLEAHQRDRFYLSPITSGELASDVSLSERSGWEAFLSPFFVLPITPDVSWHYGRTFRHLQENGQMIGANDLWIAATALAYRMAVVTSDAVHFRRVPHLEVETY
jgi:predicted nucleic acid-binding protein